jgi:excinuclease ABC subunit A
MSVKEALSFFEPVPSLHAKLKILNDVGLGYIRLGQSATTLSGGEAQRIKLAKELSRRSTGKTIYILDEPSTGLHFDDINKLLYLLQALVDQGNTVVVIEHNLDIIKTADHIIDLGPEGGKAGGEILASGTPEEVSKTPGSITGRYLKPYLNELS